MFEPAVAHHERDMAAYADLQDHEFAAEARGYTACGTSARWAPGCFDVVSRVISGGLASTLALGGSTAAAQFAA